MTTIKMMVRFVAAMCRVKWAKFRGYEVIAPPGIQAFRARQCKKCAFFEDGMCLRCKCLIFAKAMLTVEECPIGLWSRVWIKKVKSRFWRRDRQ